MKGTRTRIAPSPTGPLHIGTSRVALFNYLFAKQNKGEFILRIDDTDKERSENKYEKNIKEALEWLKLDYDEEYRQSDRGEVYKKYIKTLLDKEKAYEKDGVIYFKNEGETIKFKDTIRGEVVFDFSEIEDFIIAKSENDALYNLASVVDDHEMGITHIIRGEDHISNTPRQILLQQALQIKQPEYAHLPMILGPDRSKLSKRHGATALTDFKKDYLPEAVINYMALLGWNPGTDDELFTLNELIEAFSLEKVQKGGAIFNIEKLDWFNSQYIKTMDLKKLATLTGVGERALNLEKDRIKRLSEFKEALEFINKLPDYDKELLVWKDMTESQAGDYLKKALDGGDLKGAELWPPRVALSGQKGSPSYLDIKEVLGEKGTKKRLEKALGKLGIEK